MTQYLLLALKAAVKAGAETMKVYGSDIFIELKDDQSPLTEADNRSNLIIQEFLSELGIPILSEEGEKIPYEERIVWNVFWLVDPLDGTKEFIKRNGEFTVNIALIENGFPVLGVVYAPAKNILYFGAHNLGSYKLILAENEALPYDLQELIGISEKLEMNENGVIYTIVASRSHISPETERFIEEKKEKYGDISIVSSGSSLKLCMVAEGHANVYPRLAPTMEWDTAAGHAVAKYAGCKVYDFNDGNELHYNKEDLHNPWFVVEREPS